MRITERYLYNSFRANLAQSNRRLLEIQDQIGTGRKVNRPSDDPVGMTRILGFRNDLAQKEAFERNVGQGTAWLNTTDTVLDDMNQVLNRAKELAIAQANATMSPGDRLMVASEVQALFDQVVQLANTSVGGRYLFGGFKSAQPPFSTQGEYRGDRGRTVLEIDSGVDAVLNIKGSDFLVTDLDPILDGATPLADLNGGAGVSLGSVRITDRAGNQAVIDLSGLTTVQEVMDALNAAPGITVTTSLNAGGAGLLLIDNNGLPIQDLVVEEVGGGKTAADLGIAFGRPGAIEGTDLNPALSAATRVSSLRGGQGLSLGSIEILNGSSQVTVDLSAAQTVGEIMDAINLAGANVSAGFNSIRTALVVSSTDPMSTAVLQEIGQGTTAADLGLAGGNDILGSLNRLKEALTRNDPNAVGGALLEQLDAGVERLLALRGEVGVGQRLLENTETRLLKLKTDLSVFLSQVEDANVVDAYTQFTLEQAAFEGVLMSTARAIQPSLLNFLR